MEATGLVAAMRREAVQRGRYLLSDEAEHVRNQRIIGKLRFYADLLESVTAPDRRQRSTWFIKARLDRRTIPCRVELYHRALSPDAVL